jgi:hypothetical protein
LFGDAPSGGPAFNPYQSPGAPTPTPMQYGAHGAARGDVLAKVKPPAIAMMVYVGLWAVLVVINIVATVAMGEVATFPGQQPPQTEQEKAAQMFGVVLGVLLALGIGTMIIIGASKMMKLQSWGLALTAAILSAIPCNLCCFIGTPIGIWAIVVLASQDVKYWFQMAKHPGYGGYPQSGMPMQPPGGYGPYGK